MLIKLKSEKTVKQNQNGKNFCEDFFPKAILLFFHSGKNTTLRVDNACGCALSLAFNKPAIAKIFASMGEHNFKLFTDIRHIFHGSQLLKYHF